MPRGKQTVGRVADFRANKLPTSGSTFSVEVELSAPEQVITAYVGVNEVSGLQTVKEWKPDLPLDFFPEPKVVEEVSASLVHVWQCPDTRPKRR